MEPDTYFLNSQEALRVASRHHRSSDQDQERLQVCYYNGDKIDSDLTNLIHLPMKSLVEDLAQGELRIPAEINFDGLDLSQDQVNDIANNLVTAINQAQAYRNELHNVYATRLKEIKLDFSEPLRFYLIANECTTVMQYVSKSITNTLRKKGYEVLLQIYDGRQDYNSLKQKFEFNPHVCINVNFLQNEYTSEDVFNFTWFQDPMPFLIDETEVQLKKRDFVFSLFKPLDKLLSKKKIPFQRQSFCLNDEVFKLDRSIKREKKIVFIGSSYLGFVPTDDPAMDLAVKQMVSLFHSGVSFTEQKIDEIAEEFKVDKGYLTTRIIPFIIRDIGLLDLCQIKSKYKIEIYGWGWEKYDVLKPYYKGTLKYGEDIAKVYNSATFAFAPHQSYIIQQRVLESTACGAIPIVYDCRNLTDEPAYSEALIYFKTYEDIEKALTKKPPKKDFKRLLKDNSYDTFVDKILATVKENI